MKTTPAAAETPFFHGAFPSVALRLQGMVCLLSCAALLPSGIASAAETPERDLFSLGVDELMNETVTSVSKHEQRLGDAPAAVSVISSDDLRRSGANSIPEALRWVPGLDVGQVNAREWTVSSRGFNGVFSNKLLVLIDGRNIYTPLFAGVWWDIHHPMLEDLDRIEVIRGPGATIWGANAVNGVINVVSRSAKDTQGGLLYGSGGTGPRTSAGARYGVQWGDRTYFRVFGGYTSLDDTKLPNGQSAFDHWSASYGGFRVDHYPSADSQLTWQGDATGTTFDQGTSRGFALNTLARWTRRISDQSNFEIQVYADHFSQDEAPRSHPTQDSADFTAQHTFNLGERHSVIWGVGCRFMETKIEQTAPLVHIVNGDIRQQLYSAFAQDEFKLVPNRLTLTAGLKIERHVATGFEYQPSVRAMYIPTKQQSIWAAVSRAVRTPDQFESASPFTVTVGAPFPGPGGGLYIPTVVAGKDPKSEVLWAYEVGYRIQPSRRLNVDLTAYYNDYSRLIVSSPVPEFVPGTPYGRAEIGFRNNLEGYTYGAEGAVTVSPAERWRLTASYTFITTNIHNSAVGGQESEQTPPKHQFSLRSSLDLNPRLSLDGQVRYVAEIVGVSAYTTADLRLSYRPADAWEFAIVGQNLFQPGHLEQPPVVLTTASEVPRSVYGKLTWRF